MNEKEKKQLETVTAEEPKKRRLKLTEEELTSLSESELPDVTGGWPGTLKMLA